jgi:uncharacterized protein involved in exopolysaccharide biosynthesis
MGFAAVFALYSLKHPMYRVEAKILAQQQQVPAILRSGPDDNPARTAWEFIHRRDNLLALIKNAHLLDPSTVKEETEWDSLVLRIRTWLGHEPADPLVVLVTLLDKRLQVNTEEGTITVTLDWPDPKQAYAIVEGVLQNFIEARHVQEVTALDEVMSVLRVRAANAKDQLDRVIDQVRRESLEGTREVPVAIAAPPARAPRGPSDELIRVKSLLDAKERAIQDVEEFRRRRLADANAKLDEMRNTYSEAHPFVIQLRQDIEALSKESPQLQGLRDQAVELRKDYQARLAQEGSSSGSSSPAAPLEPSRSVSRVRPASARPVEEDGRVQDAALQYQQIVEKVNTAQLELDAIRAGFKYRYNVVWPPQIPREPRSPNPVKIFGVGFVAAFVLAFLAAALPDLSSGRIVERWQVERGLGITVLAEIQRK